MAGENCVISIPRFGRASVKALSVSYGMQLFTFGSSNDEQSRTGRQFFTSMATSGSFELTLAFSSFRAHQNFMFWLQKYVRWQGDPNTESSPARVVIAKRNFDKTAVLKSGITFGDQVGRILHKATLSFIGSRDPLDIQDLAALSSQVNPTGDRTLVRLYPAGHPMAGKYSWNSVGAVADAHFEAADPNDRRIGGV